jgi:soluble P-type ATPase
VVIEIEVPGRGAYHLEHLVLDVNGTITLEGQLIDGVTQRLARLRSLIAVHLITADTRGRQAVIDAQLGLEAVRIASQDQATQKAAFVQRLGGESVCAVGNGAIDAAMLRDAGLAIAVLGGEGLATSALNAADVVVPSINAGLDLLLSPLRLVATLRR